MYQAAMSMLQSASRSIEKAVMYTGREAWRDGVSDDNKEEVAYGMSCACQGLYNECSMRRCVTPICGPVFCLFGSDARDTDT